MSQARRVLWVLGDGDMAGVARHALDVVREGIPGWRQSFLLPDGPLGEALRDAGADVLSVNIPFDKTAGTIRSVTALRRSIGQISPDVVHSHLSWADVITTLGTLRTRLPTVTTEHGIADVMGLYNPSPPVAAAKRALHRWRLRHTDGLIAVSRATERSVVDQWGLGRTQVHVVIPNGVDPPCVVPPRQGLRVGVISRLEPEKRIELAIRAFGILHRRRPDATLDIAGTGALESDLRRLVTEEGLGDCVTFLGHVNPAAFWPRIDVLVQTSWWENCSYTLLDAAANGRGVVATDVGGNREILPPECLVGRDPGPKEVADRLEQQSNYTCNLPAGWPSVAAMTASIAVVYNALTR